MSERVFLTFPGVGMAPGVYKFEGPGMPRHANTAWMGGETPERQAERVRQLLAAAFEAGKEAGKREVRHALGVYTPL